MQGLDEPELWQFAYHIDTNKQYIGFITKQTDTTGGVDRDVYEFSLQNSGILKTKVFNITAHNIGVKIFDANYNLVSSQYSNGLDSIVSQVSLPPGNYYLQISDTVVGQDHLSYYNFTMDFTAITDIVSNELSDGVKIFPNPCNGNFTISSPFNDKANLQILDIGGRVVYSCVLERKGEHNIDVSYLSSGMYFIQLDDGYQKIIKKLLIN